MAEPSVFVARLRGLCQECALTQEDLAELAGASTQTIRKLEGGTRRASRFPDEVAFVSLAAAASPASLAPALGEALRPLLSLADTPAGAAPANLALAEETA